MKINFTILSDLAEIIVKPALYWKEFMNDELRFTVCDYHLYRDARSIFALYASRLNEGKLNLCLVTFSMLECARIAGILVKC